MNSLTLCLHRWQPNPTLERRTAKGLRGPHYTTQTFELGPDRLGFDLVSGRGAQLERIMGLATGERKVLRKHQVDRVAVNLMSDYNESEGPTIARVEIDIWLSPLDKIFTSEDRRAMNPYAPGPGPARLDQAELLGPIPPRCKCGHVKAKHTTDLGCTEPPDKRFPGVLCHCATYRPRQPRTAERCTFTSPLDKTDGECG